MSGAARFAFCAVCLLAASCAGARHRKVAGPPPEYEPPDDPGAVDASDSGAASPSADAHANFAQ